MAFTLSGGSQGGGYSQYGAYAGAAAGMYFGGPQGAQAGASAGAFIGSLFGQRNRAHVNPERWASALQAAICLKVGAGGRGCAPADLRPFVSEYWERTYPTSAAKWKRFANTGRPQWTVQWLEQAVKYEAQRAQLQPQQGLQLGARALMELRRGRM